jgi:hypothetical protein
LVRLRRFTRGAALQAKFSSHLDINNAAKFSRVVSTAKQTGVISWLRRKKSKEKLMGKNSILVLVAASLDKGNMHKMTERGPSGISADYAINIAAPIRTPATRQMD